ncbi:oligopeptide/dipeptide ABC transporter ATP-binding protein [Streptomyces sp. NPDC008317]|uniref:oligopeptide/dipeptide ABC transporter ATP-binding protein n=1 Tax=Streptomyces sp. NPDC008317 TaxID=3364827 RepID=UPI0036E596D2
MTSSAVPASSASANAAAHASGSASGNDTASASATASVKASAADSAAVGASAPAGSEPVLQVDGLRTEFTVRSRGLRHTLRAVDGVDLVLRPGETLAVVGESGSGKSTLARSILRLVEPAAGRVTVAGRPLSSFRDRREVYRDVQMVFQDPRSSLDPRQKIRSILDEPLRLHLRMPAPRREARIRELLASVELSEDLLDRLPAALSGGQRQRIGIARALAVQPRAVILDEPTASLDASTRGVVLDLLARLQRETGIAYLLISHDLQAVRRIAHRVQVMYVGRVVESGTTEEVLRRPAHPYTRALLDAAPVAAYGGHTRAIRLSGENPGPFDLSAGCALAPRCPLAEESCTAGRPPQLSFGGTHDAACPITHRQVSADLSAARRERQDSDDQ